MGLKFKLKSLEEIPEDLRGHYKELDDGFVLDVEGMEPGKTEADVQRLNTALQKERTDHKATKEKLRAYDEFGTPDELRDKLEEQEAGSGGDDKLRERLQETTGKLRQAEKELREIKPQFDTFKAENEKFQKDLDWRDAETRISEIVEKMQGVNSRALRNTLTKDYRLGLLKRNEVGEIVDADSVLLADYAKTIAEDQGLFAASQGGNSKPGAGGASGAGGGDFISEIADGLNG